MERYSDDELVRQIKNGDPAAFDRIIDRYYKSLFNFLLRMLNNREDAEDSLQETFLRAAAGMEKYRMRGRFKSWLFTIANNLAVSKIRERRRRKIFFRLDPPENEPGFAHTVEILPDDSFEPGKAAENKELAELLDSAVLSLPLKQRQVFLLRHVSELSFKEISESLNIPLNTALGRMHYAVRNLKKTLGDEAPL